MVFMLKTAARDKEEAKLDAQQIRLHRLFNTGLIGSSFNSPVEVIEHLGAVQAQDFAAAKWAVGLRMQKATDQTIEQAFNEGKILRTHVMRPTWHFVMPQDIKWMLELTAPQVKKLLVPSDRNLGITKELLSLSQKTFQQTLEGNTFLTRLELGAELEKRGVKAKGQLLAHIIMHAELDGIVCSGPRKAKQFTYSLLDERATGAQRLTREESLGKLALKYFVGHGPAQVKDFAWWSGLSMEDAKQGLKLTEGLLETKTVEDKTYWFTGAENQRPDVVSGYLLSIYDEYTIGYRDRSVLGEERIFERLISMGNALTAVMVFDGQIVGTWKRQLKKNKIEIKLSPFKELDPNAKLAFEKAVDKYSQFLELPIALV